MFRKNVERKYNCKEDDHKWGKMKDLLQILLTIAFILFMTNATVGLFILCLFVAGFWGTILTFLVGAVLSASIAWYVRYWG